jgi:ribonuclease E
MNLKTNERILINATQEEEIRIALTSDQTLENIFIEEFGGHRTGNIYKGKISKVVPSLQAAFVDYGSERHGFLPLKEVAPEYFRAQHTNNHHHQYSIAELLIEGQEIIVQVEKEERGNKGAALTSFITLAGCYLVLMPNNPKAGGISRRIEGDERDSLKALMNALSAPEDMGLIIRTAGVGKAIEELQWDLDILLRLWDAIKQAGASQPAPCLIHEESDVVIRAFRDYLRKDVSEIIIDSPKLYQQARHHLARIHPEIVNHVKLYDDKSIPLFSRYHIESQIETAFKRDVRLPSGGFIVIQETEALVAIDVNSARDTKSDNIEKTAFNTNREAAIEVARQLRLRDLGGLIIIDFIDMESQEHKRQILETFNANIVSDKARVQFGQISRFGLLEVSRQRLRPSLREASQIACPRCNGLGSIRSIESMGLHLLRLIRHEAINDNVAEIIVQVPIDVAILLLNEKRHLLDEIEKHQKILVRIIPNPHIQTPDYKIDRIYGMQTSQLGKPSYAHQEEAAAFDISPSKTNQATKREEPLVKPLEAPIKPTIKPKKVGLFQRLFSLLQLREQNKTKEAPVKTGQHHGRRDQRPYKKNYGNHQQNTQGNYQRQGQNRYDNKRRNPNQRRDKPQTNRHRDYQDIEKTTDENLMKKMEHSTNLQTSKMSNYPIHETNTHAQEAKPVTTHHAQANTYKNTEHLDKSSQGQPSAHQPSKHQGQSSQHQPAKQQGQSSQHQPAKQQGESPQHSASKYQSQLSQPQGQKSQGNADPITIVQSKQQTHRDDLKTSTVKTTQSPVSASDKTAQATDMPRASAALNKQSPSNKVEANHISINAGATSAPPLKEPAVSLQEKKKTHDKSADQPITVKASPPSRDRKLGFTFDLPIEMNDEPIAVKTSIDKSSTPMSYTVHIEPEASPVVIHPSGARLGDKARKYHQRQLADQKKNPYKYKIKQKLAEKIDPPKE